MRILRAHSRSGASFTRSRDERALQSLAGLLWESVARVADGNAPDGEDRAIIKSAQFALQGQREMLDYVAKRASAPPPTGALRGTDTLVDLLWIAAEQLEVEDLLSGTRSDGIELLIGTLDKIADGDEATARTWDRLFARVAALVESAGTGAALTY